MTTPAIDDALKENVILLHEVMERPEFRQMTPAASAVLMQLLAQCYGKNNGEQMATHEMAKEWGVKSKTTLARVLRELVDAKLIVQTYSKPGERSRYGINFPPYSDYLKAA